MTSVALLALFPRPSTIRFNSSLPFHLIFYFLVFLKLFFFSSFFPQFPFSQWLPCRSHLSLLFVSWFFANNVKYDKEKAFQTQLAVMLFLNADDDVIKVCISCLWEPEYNTSGIPQLHMHIQPLNHDDHRDFMHEHIVIVDKMKSQAYLYTVHSTDYMSLALGDHYTALCTHGTSRK